VELGWETPATAPIYRRLAPFARLITFDKRGMGLSGRSAALPTLEERMDDVRAVMDAAGSGSASLVGMSEGGPMSLLFAATYPERVTRLVLWSTFARLAWAPDYPFGVEQQLGDAFCDQLQTFWGTGRVWPVISTNDSPEDVATRRRYARLERNSATPAMASAANRFRYGSTLVRRLTRSRRRRWLSTAARTRSHHSSTGATSPSISAAPA
jgi:pimeloyl-ACP methyl ester carboxylesterase